MPELPEVETTRRGIAPWIEGHRVAEVIIRQRRLRYPVPRGLEARLKGKRLQRVRRRAKYLLLEFEHGTAIIHLGMSGSLRILDQRLDANKHDHFDIRFDNGKILRYRDPRRFGALLWCDAGKQHKLLGALGPEPLSDTFDGERLFTLSRKRKSALKTFIMDNHVVVGVGNIYASEALFLAGLRPGRAAGGISRQQCAKLAAAIKQVLTTAIEAGGTTLRDFTSADGAPGYFALQLNVYGRAGEACPVCGTLIKQKVIGQRNSYYCPHCQH